MLALQWDKTKAFYQSSELIQGLLQGAALLIPLVAMDGFLGAPQSLRLAYIGPVWRGALRGGREAGLITAVFAATSATITSGANVKGGWIINLLIAGTMLCLMVLGLDRQRTQLHRAIEDAERDPLTGAANRLALERKASAALAHSVRYGTELSLAMIDCDKFKALNDIHGHAFGDQVLIALVRTLNRTLPGLATVVRTGGDEFIVLLPKHDLWDLDRALARASDRFGDATLVMGAPATFSYGVAGFGRDGITLSQMLDAADQDMYRRKLTRTFQQSFPEAV